MKLVSYKLKNKPGAFRIGYVEDGKVIDLQEGYCKLLISKNDADAVSTIDYLLPSDPVAFYSLGKIAINRAKESYAYVSKHRDDSVMFTEAEVSFGTPISNPSKIICVGKNYAEHAQELKSDVPDLPVLFAKFSNALIGPEDNIEKSRLTEKLDYEAELALVIGKEASQVKREDALDYIAGYTIGNDISARDMQKRTPQWLQGKTHDRSTPIGPWVVTADEVGNPQDLSIRSFVNGEKRQESHTSHMIFNVPFLIEFISSFVTLKPGDIILTGTPEGVGLGMNPPQFLSDGDVVAVEIEKIGKLENTVVDENGK